MLLVGLQLSNFALTVSPNRSPASYSNIEWSNSTKSRMGSTSSVPGNGSIGVNNRVITSRQNFSVLSGGSVTWTVKSRYWKLRETMGESLELNNRFYLTGMLPINDLVASLKQEFHYDIWYRKFSQVDGMVPFQQFSTARFETNICWTCTSSI